MLITILKFVIIGLITYTAANRWIRETVEETKTAFSTKGEIIIFAITFGYAVIAFLLALTPVGWIGALLMAVLILVFTIVMASYHISTWKVALLEEFALAFATCSAMGVSSISGLKSLAGTYLELALIVAIFTVIAEKVAMRWLKTPVKVPSKAKKAEPVAKAQAKASAQPATTIVVQPTEEDGTRVVRTTTSGTAGTSEPADELHRNVNDSLKALDAEHEPATPKQPQQAKKDTSKSDDESTPFWQDVIWVAVAAAALGVVVWVFVAFFAPAFGLFT